jgi:hypothetical protein
MAFSMVDIFKVDEEALGPEHGGLAGRFGSPPPGLRPTSPRKGGEEIQRFQYERVVVWKRLIAVRRSGEIRSPGITRYR